ncbi:MAG: alpha/beta hydrolase [Limisphaerales bacterium]
MNETFEEGRGWRAGERVARWIAVAVVGLWVTGCSPTTYLARRMMSAPNRVPDFVKPEGRVWLEWPEGVFERFPSGTNRLGNPAVELRWVAVEPADYGWSTRVSTETNRSRVRARFRFDFKLPTEGLPPARPAKGTVYVLHGYGVDLETVFPWAVFLAEAGWRSVLIDLPGHGHSGGRQVTFGIREVALLEEFRRTVGESKGWLGPSIAFGHSMGAALALRWQAADRGIAGSVAMGAYSEFVPAALRLRDDYARWIPRGWVRRAAGKVPRLLGVAPERMDTLASIHGCDVVALLVASAEDVVTPPEDSAALLLELGRGSELLIVGNASHEALPFHFDQHGEHVLRWIGEVVEQDSGRARGLAGGR